MNMDWLNDLLELDESAEYEPLAALDPEKWLLQQLESSDQCYTKVDSRHYRTAAIKNGTHVQIEVNLDDDGLLRMRATSGIVTSPETEIPFRILQMSENATFKATGYEPAKAGEPVVFQVRIRPYDGLDVGKIVDQCMYSTALQKTHFEAIQNGKTAAEVGKGIHSKRLKAALALHGLMD